MCLRVAEIRYASTGNNIECYTKGYLMKNVLQFIGLEKGKGVGEGGMA